MGSKRGALEPPSTALEMPTHLSEKGCEIFALLDERHQAGRIGCWRRSKKAPAVSVSRSLAIRAGGWASETERWGELLAKPFAFKRSPQNRLDPNAIMITPSGRGKLLGYLS